MRFHRGASAGALVAALAASGCVGLTYSASASRAELVDRFSFRAERPIARDVRFVYVSATVLGDDAGRPLVAADPVTREGLPQGQSLASLVAQANVAPSGGTRWSEVWEARAVEARRKGELQKAASYTALSHSNLQTELAMSRMMSGALTTLAVYGGTVQLLGAVAQVGVEGTGAGVRDWIVENTGAVGPEAPEGSVLTLRLFQITNGRKFKTELRMDFVVVATLADGRGRTVQSTRSWQMWGQKREGSSLAGTGLEAPADATPFDPARVVPEREQARLKALTGKAWAPQLVVAANAAVADLYARLDALGADEPTSSP